MEEQVRFIVNNEKEEQMHWSRNLEIFLVLQGECTFCCQGETSRMCRGDLWVVNPFSLYQVIREPGSAVLTVFFSEGASESLGTAAEQEIFCRSDLQEEMNREMFTELRQMLAELFGLCVKEKNKSSLLIKSDIYRILYFLEQGFSVRVPQKEEQTPHSLERLRRILLRIHRDYAENITLKQIAEEEYLSMNYLSRYFQQKTGVGFNQYLNQVRLQAAAGYLMNTGISITEIGHRCGFKDATQFIRRFRESYGVTPGKYRGRPVLPDQTEGSEQELFRELTKYKGNKKTRECVFLERVRNREIEADASAKGKKLNHSWKNLVNIGFAKEGLTAVIQNQLSMIQREIGFKYVHFHGLFDDDMMVYTEQEDGTPVYNFKYVDMLFDFFLSIGLKPYVELSYMPSALSGKSRKLFIKNVNFGMPRDMGKWCGLVGRLTAHCIERYGPEEILSWRFLPWCGPAGYAEYGYYQMSEYYEFYRRTYQTLKAIDPRLEVGGPSMDSYFLWERGGEYEKFIEYALENQCRPDFISICGYPSKKDEKETGEDIVLIEKPEALPRATSRDEEYFRHLLEHLEKYHKKIEGRIPEFVFIEWNSSIWQRDLTNDTSFKASFIAKTLLDNYDRASAFGYWALSDYMEEVAPAQEELHGGFGLITCQNIKKSGYYCMELLNMLGERMIGRGEGYFITKKMTGQIQVFLYNYVHFNKLYRYRHQSGVDRTHRGEAFLDGDSIRYRINIEGIQDWTSLKLREYEISRNGGSVYDVWKEMGAPAVPNPEEVEYLQKSAVPVYKSRVLKKEEFRQMEYLLVPHSVKLILIDKADSD